MKIRSGNSNKKMNLLGIDSSLWADSGRLWRTGDIEGGPKITPISFFRLNFFHIGAIIVLLFFLGRLFVLTIVAGDENRELAEGNRIKLVELEAERGKILDRYGRELAQSKTVYILKNGDEEREIDEVEVKRLEGSGLAGEYFEGTLGKIERRVVRNFVLGAAGA